MLNAAKTLLPELRERVRRIERSAATVHGVLPFGIAAIDRALPGGGLARGALHEILGAGGDEEDGALAAAFAASIIGCLGTSPTSPSLSALGGGEGRGEVGAILWCLPRPDLYGPGLAAHGLDPGRVVLVRASRDAEILWAMEEGLRAPGIVAVVGEVGSLPTVASRRLQLAAERSGVTAFLLRRWRDGGQAVRERALPNAAVTRWCIAALPSRPMWDEPGIGRPRWRIELMRCRGGEPGCWEMEVPDATDHVSLAAALADRPAAPVAAEKYRHAG
jgi:protein ImuA